MATLSVGLLFVGVWVAPASPLVFPRDIGAAFGSILMFTAAVAAAYFTDQLWSDLWKSESDN